MRQRQRGRERGGGGEREGGSDRQTDKTGRQADRDRV